MVERGKERVRDRKRRKRGVRHKQNGRFGVGQSSREKIEGKRQRGVTEGTRETERDRQNERS